MKPTGVVLAGRRAAEGLMQDTCVITAAVAGGVLDEATLTYTDPAPTVLYDGPCRVRSYRSNNDRVVQAGEQPVSLWPYTVSVPMSVTGLKVDLIVTITGSTLDPDLPGLVLRVRDVLHGSQITARRLGCEVNAG